MRSSEKHTRFIAAFAIILALAGAARAQVDATAIVPSELSYLGGTPFEITGTGFAAPATVRIGTVNAVVLSVEPDRITGLAPAQAASPLPLPVLVVVSGVGLDTIPDAATYVGPLALTEVSPSAIVQGAPAEIRILGVALTPATAIEIGGVAAGPVTYIGVGELRVPAPPLPLGEHDVEATAPNGTLPPVVATLEAPNGLEVIPPISIDSFSPAAVSSLGGTPFVITGGSFGPGTTVRIGGAACPVAFVSGNELEGIALLPEDAVIDQAYDVEVVDPVSGSAILPGGAIVRGPLAILSVDPPVAPAFVTNAISIGGVAFTPDIEVFVDGNPCAVTYLDPFQLGAIVPILDPRIAEVTLVDHDADGEEVRVTLELALTLHDPALPTIASVEPAEACGDGGTFVSVHGSGFIPETLVYVNGTPLVGTIIDLDGTRASGHVAAGAAGPATVVVSDFRGFVEAPGLLEIISPCPELLPPEQFETSLAEGTARFRWHNPEPYASIEVRTTGGALLDILPGSATFFEVGTGGEDEVELVFQAAGSDPAVVSGPVGALAMVHPCDYPPPLDGAGKPGELDLVVFGDHAPADVERCSDGSGPVLIAAPPLYAQPQGATGFVKPQWTRSVPGGGSNERSLIVGFTLEQDAELLEFSGFYRKLAVDFGLSLRGHLVHVFPNSGFEDEFTFPDSSIAEGKEWHTVTYFRGTDDAASEISLPCEDGSGGLKEIPAGDYRLEIYAVGGDEALPYYVFADDSRDVESLIEGTPCPPYPMVRVRDVTGLRTLPNVESISVEFSAQLPDGQVAVALFARGTWFDENGVQWSIDPFCDHPKPVRTTLGLDEVCLDPPYQAGSDFEYEWSVGSVEPEIVKVDGPTTILKLPDWGCYPVRITVRDLGCATSRTVFQEIAVAPTGVDLCDSGGPFSFVYPTPDPGSLVGIVDLQNHANGDFDGVRPIELRVLVAPQCTCDGTRPCEAAQVGDGMGQPDSVEFRLAVATLVPGGPSGFQFVYDPLPAPIEVEDLCPEVTEGLKYFKLTIADIGSIPSNPLLGNGYGFAPVTFQGRATAGNDAWHSFGSFLSLANSPPMLQGAHWSGHFDPQDASYHFLVRSSQDTEQEYAFGNTVAIDFGLADAGIPAYADNRIAGGFTTRFTMQGKQWSTHDASATSSGSMLENDLKGVPQQVEGELLPALGPGSPPVWQWCSHRNVFNSHFSQTLFEALIYAGTIVVVPVEIWGSVGLGLSFDVDSYVEATVSLFAPLPGGHNAEIQFSLASQVELSIPVEVSVDILGGIASVTLGLVPRTTFDLIPSILTTYSAGGSPSVAAEHTLHADLALDMTAEACVQTLVLGEQCSPTVEIPLIDPPVTLLHSVSGTPLPPGSCGPGAASAAGSSAASASSALLGQAGGTIYEQAIMPFSIVSPDGSTVVDGYATEDSVGKFVKVIVREAGEPEVVLSVYTSFPSPLSYFVDPQAAFIADDHAIIIGTAAADGYSPLLPPADPNDPAFLSSRNQNIAHAEIQIAHLIRVGGVWDLVSSGLTEISDLAGTPPAQRRADGRPSIAGDLSTGEALAAWVRYGGDYLIEDGVKTFYRPTPGCAETFCPQSLPWVRPQMEDTAIVVRRVDASGLIAGEGTVTISEPGINVQPAIAVSPSGDTAYCVWVHDPTHVDLVGTNIGRRLRYSIFQKSTGTWSAPQDVVPVPDDHPGILEPIVALSGDHDGAVGFTALLAGAPTRDSGLGGGSRHLYVSRLVAGVFQPPERIRNRCEDRVYGFGQSLTVDLPELLDPVSGLFIEPCEILVGWMDFGAKGLPGGSGGVMVSAYGGGAWSPPISLVPPGRVMANVVTTVGAGAIHSIHFDSGAADPGTALLGSGPSGYQFVDTPLLPDAAIAGLELSQTFPSPGVTVTARIAVENRGFASTPYSGAGASGIGLELSFVGFDGTETVVQGAPLPVLGPNESHSLELPISMPHEPALLRARITPNPLDRDESNDVAEIPFGAPPPTELSSAIGESTLGDETTFSVSLSWSAPVAYDEIRLYRDGSMLHTLPGTSLAFVDPDVAPGPHLYEVRGVIGASKSAKAQADCCVDCGPPPPAFLRGDANGDGDVNIADPIRVLQYLFNGGAPAGCFASSDANLDGLVNIADPITLLGYLFQSSAPPPAPFPACGVSTAGTDAALGCAAPGC